MRSRKRLVQVQVHNVHAEVARAHFADQCVHVRAVHIEQAALGMKNVGDFVDLLLEDAERVRIGQHQGGDIFVHLRLQCRDLHHPLHI